jgi:hypothetical protein
MRATVLGSARRLGQLSGFITGLAGLAALGFGLTNVVFSKPSSHAHRVTVTVAVSTTVTTHAAQSPASHSSGIWLILGITGAASGAGGAAAAGLAAARRRTRKRVDERIDQIGPALTDFETLVQEVREVAGLNSKEEDLVKQRLRRHLVEAVSRDAIDLELLDFLPHRPRSVKRALNDLKLRTALAVAAGVITAESPVQARHLTKWVVLVHRWPALAESVEETPSLLTELECGDAADDAPEALAVGPRGSSDQADLKAFMAAEPKLAEVLNAVATLRPASLPS